MNTNCPYPHHRPGPPRRGDPPCLCRGFDFMGLVNCILVDIGTYPAFWGFLLIFLPYCMFLAVCSWLGWK